MVLPPSPCALGPLVRTSSADGSRCIHFPSELFATDRLRTPSVSPRATVGLSSACRCLQALIQVNDHVSHARVIHILEKLLDHSGCCACPSL